MNKSQNQFLDLQQDPNHYLCKKQEEKKMGLPHIKNKKQFIIFPNTGKFDSSFLKQKFDNQSPKEKYPFLVERKKKTAFIEMIDKVQIKREKNRREYPIEKKSNLLDQIKNSSFQKAPFFQNRKFKSPTYQFCRTIDPNDLSKNLFLSNFIQKQQFNKPNSSQIQLKSDSKIIRPMQNQLQITSHQSAQNNKKQKNQTKHRDLKLLNYSYQTNCISLGIDNRLLKHNLKNIVDRYFPSIEMQFSSRKKKLNSFQSDNNRSQNLTLKFPSLKSAIDKAKRQTYNSSKAKFNGELKKKKNQLEQQNSNSPQKPIQRQGLVMKNNSHVDSLNQVYTLDQISQKEQFYDQEISIGNYYGDFSHSPSSKSTNSKEQFSCLKISPSQSIFFNQIRQDKPKQEESKFKQKKIKFFQNNQFSIFKVKITVLQTLSQSNDLKTVFFQYQIRKYFKSEASKQLKNRQLKAKEIINKNKNCLQILFFWEQDQYDSNCIKINFNKFWPFGVNSWPFRVNSQSYGVNSWSSGMNFFIFPTLSKSLLKIKGWRKIESGQYLEIRAIEDVQFLNQDKLMTRFHRGILKMVQNLCEQLQPLSEIIINNNICLNNILVLQQDRYGINEWSYSYFRQQYLIQNNKFEKRLEPILKNQLNQWFVAPQYLAPEILQNLCFPLSQLSILSAESQPKSISKTINKQIDLFFDGNKSDVWSLGLMLLEIITLIPIWIPQNCLVLKKNNTKILPRKGLLHCQNRNVAGILKKQCYLKENLKKILRIQSQPYTIDNWLIDLLDRMLDLNYKTRISLREILKLLEKQQKVIDSKLNNHK